MGILSGTKKAFGHIFNLKVNDWFNSDQHKINVKYIYTAYTGLFNKDLKEKNGDSTFEEAMVQLGLTEEDLVDRKREFFRLFIIFLIFTFILFIYTMFITLKYKTIYGFILGLSVTFLSFVNVFKYHFWLKQINLRKLGLTFKEWLN